jgi:hypothetical protein
VQGQLRKERLSFTVQTECVHCAQPIHIEMDSELRYHVTDEEAEPIIFAPHVDFAKLTDPSIIDAF